MTNLEQINEIVYWWLELPSDYKDLNELLYARQRLSGHLFLFAQELAQYRRDWSGSQAKIEKVKNQSRVKFMATDSSAQKADYKARANMAADYEQDKINEALYFGTKHVYDSVEQVLESMNQRIAHLREEWRLENFRTNV